MNLGSVDRSLQCTHSARCVLFKRSLRRVVHIVNAASSGNEPQWLSRISSKQEPSVRQAPGATLRTAVTSTDEEVSSREDVMPWPATPEAERPPPSEAAPEASEPGTSYGEWADAADRNRLKQRDFRSLGQWGSSARLVCRNRSPNVGSSEVYTTASTSSSPNLGSLEVIASAERIKYPEEKLYPEDIGAAAAVVPSAEPEESSKGHWSAADISKAGTLLLLSLAYVHQATTGFALPAMLPMVSHELGLDDLQGAMLTTGYSYLYAAALLPIGVLADKVQRPKLLAWGLTAWSLLTMLTSGAQNFSALLVARVGLAAAAATQNPVCFSLIPELFPKNKSTALAVYNCAIYLGRALSFASVMAARPEGGDGPNLVDSGASVGLEATAAGLILVPLDKLDLRLVSIVYTRGDMAAIVPNYNYATDVDKVMQEFITQLTGNSWRQVMSGIALPGFLIAGLVALTVAEPRDKKREEEEKQAALEASVQPASASLLPQHTQQAAGSYLTRSIPFLSTPQPTLKAEGATHGQQSVALTSVEHALLTDDTGGVMALVRNPTFLATTLAAAMNDVGSYALIAWQSTFYERVYHLDPSSYAPVLASLLPIGGIIGGVGGGLLADQLAKKGQRVWITAGASLLSAPFFLKSLTAATHEESFLALFVGFALSEAWRAPTAVMAKSCAPASMGSTASAVYLCVRNLVGGIGPLGVALLSPKLGLQNSMLMVPGCYLASGLLFIVAEALYNKREKQRQAAQAALLP